MSSSNLSISYRVATPEEDDFFRRLFHLTRGPEFAQAPMNEQQLTEFLDSQYSARKVHYDAHYPSAKYELVLLDEETVGGSIVQEIDVVHLIDITILPEYRNRGIGTRFMEDLIQHARSIGKDVMLHVEYFNPAKSLYERLGFTETGLHGLYYRMVWKPE